MDRGRGARRRALGLSLASDTPPSALAPRPQLTWPQPQGWDDPDRNAAGAPSPNGARGTYNHLIDAVLDVPATRAM